MSFLKKIDLISAWRRAEAVFTAFVEPIITLHPRLVLSVLTLLWLIPGTSQLPLVDRDEPRFAYATQEMIDNGEAVIPTFNGEYRFDKPPFVYWWMRLNYLVPGMNEFTARAHSIFSTLLVVLLTWGFAARLYGRTVAFWSSFAFLTCLQVFIHGRLCVADMSMMIFIVAAQWAMWELLKKSSWRWALAFWVALALGFTTKWIVPWAVAALSYICFFALKFPWNWKSVKVPLMAFKNFKPLSGSVLMLALILLWGVPAWLATGGEFFKIGLGHHVLDRGLQPIVASRPGNPFFYLLSAFVSLMPWLALVGGVVAFLRKNFGDKERFLAGWVLGVYVLFSLAQTQLPHYAMPAFPALFMLLGAATGFEKPRGIWAGAFFRFFFGVWFVIVALALCVVLLMPVFGAVSLGVKLAGLCLVLVLLALLGMGLARAKNLLLATSLGFVSVVMFFWGGAACLQGLNPGQQVAGLLHKQEIFPDTLVACGFEEPSLTAYAQATWEYQGDYARAKATYESAENAALVVLAREYTLQAIPSALLKMAPKARQDKEKILLQNPPLGGRRVRLEGVNLGRFSVVLYDLYLKP